MGQKEVTSTWRNYWIRHKTELREPTNSSPIFDELKKITKSFNGKKVLEAGSGIGEISIDVADRGAKTYLLDISRDALELSKRFIEQRNIKAHYINGDIFHIPFSDDSFDIVWNAGVVEHFQFHDQVSILSEIKRVVRPGGLVVVFNPFAHAKLYRWGKRIAEEKKTWEFGEEYPVESMEEIGKASGLQLLEESSFFFERQITFLKNISPFIFRIYKTAFLLTGGNRNPFWKKRYNGYLLASVLTK